MSAAIAETGAGDAPARAGELVGDLFDLDPALAAPRRKADRLETPGKRGPGRPKGSKNKRSSEWVQYLGSQYTMPLENLVAIGDMAPDELLLDLVARAGAVTGRTISLKDWSDEKILAELKAMLQTIVAANNAALPYLHERRGAVVDDGEGNDVPFLAFGQLIAPKRGEGRPSGRILDVTPRNLRSKQNQQVRTDGAGEDTPDEDTQSGPSD